MNIDRRLEQMRERLERSKPCQITITLKSGEQIETDPVGAWAVCHDHMCGRDVANVTASKPEYAEIAGLIAALCRPPAPNRRIEDYE